MKEPATSPTSSLSPIFYFFLFSLLNAFLAYSRLPELMKFPIGLVGLIALGWQYLKKQPTLGAQGESLFHQESFRVSPWLLGATLFLALAVRLYPLTSFSAHPNIDEFAHAYLAIHQMEKWSWYPFYFYTQNPPLYFWALALFFNLFGVSLRNIWIFPALLSFGSVFFFYLAAKETFSKSISFVCLILLSFSFWPVFSGRFCVAVPLMVFWQAVTFWVLSKWRRADSPGASKRLAIFLGLCWGVGFYTYFAWALVAALIALTVAFLALKPGSNKKRDFYLCGAVGLLTVCPLLAAGVKYGFGNYIFHQFILNQTQPQDPNFWKPLHVLYYFTKFLWGGRLPNPFYWPSWGGFLNPILGSFFIMGALQLWKSRQTPIARWIFLSASVLFFPILLSNSGNGYHVVALLPLFLLISALGFHLIYPSLPKFPRVFFLMACLSLSLSLDAINMKTSMEVADNSYHNMNFHNYNRMMDVLNQAQAKYGPGLIFPNFLAENFWYPCFLTVSTYPFNPLVNPSLETEKTTWAALLTDKWSRSFFKERFLKPSFYHCDPPGVKRDHDFLVCIPLTPENRKILEGWRAASSALQEADSIGFNLVPGKPTDSVIRYLLEHQKSFQDSPFLRFYFLERLGDQYEKNGQVSEALQSLQEAYKIGANGYVLDKLGKLLFKTNRFKEALEVLSKVNQYDGTYRYSYYDVPPELSPKPIDEPKSPGP